MVYVTQAAGEQRLLIALDRRNGRVRWSRGLRPVGTEKTHRHNPLCSSSPVTDGERVIAWFGSSGVVAFNLNGEPLWHVNLGRQSHQFGYGSSPVLDQERVYLNFGPGISEFIVALDKRTGRELWRVTSPTSAADDTYGTWSTPFLTEAEGKPQLLIALRDYFAGVDPSTGTVIWHSGGMGLQAKSSPIAGDGVALIAGDLRGAELAVRLNGTGDITETGRVWREFPARSRVATGIIHDGHVYGARANGLLDCIDLETGNVVWAERQAGAGANSAVWASPILVGEHLYFINQGGDTVILKAAPGFEIVAINSIGETCNASLAIAHGDLFIRSWERLWCIRPVPES
jgi:outer membrane protein assembly factor BamB